MNKARRHEVKMLKYKRRVKLYGYEHTDFRTTGKPCSCMTCSPNKIKANGLRKRAEAEIKESRVDAYEYLLP